MSAEAPTPISSLAAEWDELADRVDAPPWLRPAWFEAWTGAFADGAELEIFSTRDEGRLTGVLPMLRRGRALASPANWHTPEFRPLAADAEAFSGLVATALDTRPRAFALSWIPAEELDPVRSAAKGAGYLAAERPVERSPYLPLESDDKIPRASTVRRHRRKLEGEGDLRLDVETGVEHLDDGFRLEASGWKGEQGTAIVSAPNTQAFYERIAAWSSEREVLRLFFLRLAERPIAFVLAIEDNRRLYYVKGGFDVEFRQFGPGVIITHDMIEYARRQSLESFEFLGGEDRWKTEWTTQLRERRLFQAFARDMGGVARWAFHAYGRPAAKAVVTTVRR